MKLPVVETETQVPDRALERCYRFSNRDKKVILLVRLTYSGKRSALEARVVDRHGFAHEKDDPLPPAVLRFS